MHELDLSSPWPADWCQLAPCAVQVSWHELPPHPAQLPPAGRFRPRPHWQPAPVPDGELAQQLQDGLSQPDHRLGRRLQGHCLPRMGPQMGMSLLLPQESVQALLRSPFIVQTCLRLMECIEEGLDLGGQPLCPGSCLHREVHACAAVHLQFLSSPESAGGCLHRPAPLRPLPSCLSHSLPDLAGGRSHHLCTSDLHCLCDVGWCPYPPVHQGGVH